LTLIINRGLAGPQTHALVIGVGSYSNLQTPGLSPELRTLEPLASSPVSAFELIGWLEGEYNNPSAPLGTVDCLISDPNGPAAFPRPPMRSYPIESPRMDLIQSAFDSWFDRCDQDPGNVAIFYFCGHGLMDNLGYSMLLTEDFGFTRHDPFRNSTVNFDLMARGMASNQAGTQLIIADACRHTMREARNDLSPTSSQKLVRSNMNQIHARRALVAQAAVLGSKAYTRVGQVTQFSQALLECLRGAGSERLGGGQWVVKLSRLSDALHRVLGRNARAPGAIRQPCENKTEGDAEATIHVLRSNPEVPFCIGCDPHQAMQPADFSISLNKVAAPLLRRPPLDAPPPTPWSSRAPVGCYTVSASFDPSGIYEDTSLDDEFFYPPCYDYDVPVPSRSP
jgi:hypothetical protein